MKLPYFATLLLLMLILTLVVVACGASTDSVPDVETDTPSSETAAENSSLSPPATPPSNRSAQERSPIATPSEASAEVVAAAKERLASELDISTEVVEVIAVESVEWSDASLGCPEPGKMYAQVITPGYRVLLRVEGEQFEVHTDRGGRAAVICEPDR
jgi:hypothetical protein